MKPATASAIKTLLRMDDTVTTVVRTAVIEAMSGAKASGGDMSLAEAADYLNISRSTLWRMCKDGKYGCRRGKKFYMKADEVSALKADD